MFWNVYHKGNEYWREVQCFLATLVHEYQYDITYNKLNLPSKVTIDGKGYIEYIYDAAGVKFYKRVFDNGVEDKNASQTYIGNYIYDGNGQLLKTLHEEGYITADGVWHYFLRDHLGNTRVDFAVNGGVVTDVQDYHYYPFGMDFTGLNTSKSDNTYRYNGKELQEDLGLDWYDYGARFYDAQIGRWHSVDPLSEKRIWLSPYQYIQNSPIIRIDPDGMLDGDIYNLQGEHIGNDGIDDHKVYLSYTFSDHNLSQKESLNFTKGVNSPIKTALGTEVKITNEELNLRSSLSTLKQTEAGRLNEALDYNNWNHNDNFTDDSYSDNPEAYSKHPGINPNSGGSAAGAYQALNRFYTGSDFSPQNQDKAAVNNMTSFSYKAALTGDMSIFKTTTQGRWVSLDHWSVSQLQRVFNSYRAKELTGNSTIATPAGQLLRK